MNISIRSFIILLLGLITSCKANEDIYSPLFLCSNLIEEPYGVCTHINVKGEKYEFDTRDKELSLIDSLGISWIRTDFYWNLLRDKKNEEYNYQHYDEMMRSVKKTNIKLLGILVPPNTRNEYNEWMEYINNVLIRYGDSVHYWEVINEADLRYRHPVWKWFTAYDYSYLLKNAYNSIKIINNQSNVLFTGIGNVGNKFVDSVFHSFDKQYYDVMNVHQYSQKNIEPERMIDFYMNLRSKLDEYSQKCPVWMTEYGCTTAVGWSSEEIQANRLPRVFLISFALGVEKVFWYNFRSNEIDRYNKDCHFGLCHKDYTLKPAYYAYQTLVRMCPNKSKRPVLKKIRDVYVSQWINTKGEIVYALWTSKEKNLVNLIITGKYVCYDLYGKEKNAFVMGKLCEISPSIIYIVGKNVKVNIIE